MYRPFYKVHYYADLKTSDLLTETQFEIFGKDLKQSNQTILFTAPNSAKPFMVNAANVVADLHYVGAAAGTQCLPLYRYDGVGNKVDNITAWGLAQFRTHYGEARISGEDIFHYAYAVLHDPHYRAAYAQNLKQDFPRLPFYPDFGAWATAGRQLLALHLNYETAVPHPLGHLLLSPTKGPIKPRLKANPAEGSILLTDTEALTGIPEAAWRYRIGNRSALEWVLDQYKERTPKDPTIAEHFDTYRFADHANHFTNLLARVVTVSIETMRLVDALAAQSPLRPEA